jgi:hypothetical protein
MQKGEEHMTDPKSPEWQRLYEKVLIERDPGELPGDIARAEAAIYSRLKQLSKLPKDEAERHAISDALSALRALKEEHFPGWVGKSAKKKGA